jgi:hypothetical protein
MVIIVSFIFVLLLKVIRILRAPAVGVAQHNRAGGGRRDRAARSVDGAPACGRAAPKRQTRVLPAGRTAPAPHTMSSQRPAPASAGGATSRSRHDLDERTVDAMAALLFLAFILVLDAAVLLGRGFDSRDPEFSLGRMLTRRREDDDEGR